MPFSLARRALLALFGTSAIAAAARGDVATAAAPDGSGDAPTKPTVARIAPSVGHQVVYESGAEAGSWRWQDGDFRDRIAADPLGGLVVPHVGTSPAEGAWVRDWDGVNGRAEWFGARTDDPQVDNAPAIQAALDLCPTVRLDSGIYHLRGGLRILRNGTRLLGAGVTQTDQRANDRATELLCSSPDSTILQIGSDDRAQPRTLVEGVQLRDFTIRRAVAPAIPLQGLAGAIGIAMRWCVNCHIEQVFSIDSARGWFFYGTIENYVRYCSALRGIRGTLPANDFFIGFHLDFDAPLAANGGNASLYIDHCRAFGGYGRGAPALTYSAGLRTDGGWVDLFINAFETGTVDYGIHGKGDGIERSGSFRTEDLIITNCVLDGSRLAGFQFEAAGAMSAIQISNSYSAVQPSGTAVVLFNLAGSVSLIGNQWITGGIGGTGLSAVNVSNLHAAGNIHTKLKQPIILERVTGFHLADSIQAVDGGNDYPGIGLVGCARGKVACLISARPGAMTAGVEFKRTASHGVEIDLTTIDAGGAPKLVDMGAPITRSGPFGTGNLASGIA